MRIGQPPTHRPLRGYVEIGAGVRFVDAITISQFSLLLAYASAFLHKEKAIELQLHLFKKGLGDFIRMEIEGEGI